MVRFLTEEIKEDIDYIVKNVEQQNDIYNSIEFFLRAKWKLEKTGLNGSSQEYNSKLASILNNTLKLSAFIECPLELKIPAPYPAIIDILIEDLSAIVQNEEQVKYIVDSVLNEQRFKLRKTSNAYYNHIEKLFLENDKSDESSGVRVSPDSGYEIGYTLLPTADNFILNRVADDDEVEAIMLHPIFYTLNT